TQLSYSCYGAHLTLHSFPTRRSSDLTAENGRSPGSLISVTTKGGTNAFRGSAYEYIRNKVFDARDYFNARNAAANPTSPFSKKPAYNQNQFGGAFRALK